ncbi:MAG: carbohydrate binding family 9 domain-containing protein, partial [Gemmatimonadetes bacterium]|nr:carbohydrate binding family 9 domain-containing protein [Gemmatimonadota bacterium]
MGCRGRTGQPKRPSPWIHRAGRAANERCAHVPPACRVYTVMVQMGSPPSRSLRAHAALPACAALLAAALASFADLASAQTGGRAPHGVEAVLTAVRAVEPMRIDGVLDEPVWQRAPAVSGFRQRWPVDGAPATEDTEVRVAFDQRAIYFGLMMHDSEPGRIMRSILHREGRIDKDDRVIIALDTYHDRRSAYIFALNSFGPQGDAHFPNERLVFPDDWKWEGVYESAARVTERGWELEVAIPLTTIRFDPESTGTMGVAFYRSIRRKNEEVTWPHIPLAYTGTLEGGMDQASRFATLTGLEGLRPGRHIEVKPFVIGGAQRTAGTGGTQTTHDLGLDVKWSVTPALTADLTWNTDFAQVEADEVQINLTRFSLFYPEKREFFLERSELFQFGNSGQTDLFFSRRIGLTNDILGGGRLTGQAGPFSIGFLSLQTEDNDAQGVPGANSSVLRLRRDVGSRATLGGSLTSLQSSGSSNRAAGVDLRYRFFSSSGLNVWLADTWAEGKPGSGTGAAYVGLTLRNDRFSAGAEYTDIGEAFDPALGFVQRKDMVRWTGSLGWTPRFERSSWARQLSLTLRGMVIDGQDGARQSDEAVLQSLLRFQNGNYFMVGLTHEWERLEEPFRMRPDVEIPIGDYPYDYAGILFRTNDSRAFSANGIAHFGDFWNGSWLQYGGGLTWKTGPHLELTAGLDRREIDLPVANGKFATTILGLDVLGAVSRKLFANAFIQYDSDSKTMQANFRVDWIHTPGSDLFVVVHTGYFAGDLTAPRDERWVHRAGVVRLTYL